MSETEPRSRLARLWAHPVVRWSERILWVLVALFVIERLGPQLSALTGIGPTVGTAPPFELVTLEGETIRSEDLAGRVVVVNFWATWCPPCRIEIPALQSLWEERGEEGVVVLGISTDAGNGRAVADFLEERGVTYPVGMATSEIRRAFGGITALPTTFVIGPDGVIHHRVFGFFAPPAMNAAVGRLVRE